MAEKDELGSSVCLRIRNVDEINETNLDHQDVNTVPIKQEKPEEGQSGQTVTNDLEENGDRAAPSSSHFRDPSPDPPDVKVKVEIKEEKEEKPQVAVPAPLGRTCCRFGIKCYRNNVIHRAEESHPGDPDYKMPEYPEPPPGTPKCPYGQSCYRRNPTHFQQFSHSNCPPKQVTTVVAPKAKRRRRYSNSTDEYDSGDSMLDFLNDDDSDGDPHWEEDQSDGSDINDDNKYYD